MLFPVAAVFFHDITITISRSTRTFHIRDKCCCPEVIYHIFLLLYMTVGYSMSCLVLSVFSTVSTFINSLGAVFLEDFIKPLQQWRGKPIKPSEEHVYLKVLCRYNNGQLLRYFLNLILSRLITLICCIFLLWKCSLNIEASSILPITYMIGKLYGQLHCKLLSIAGLGVTIFTYWYIIYL